MFYIITRPENWGFPQGLAHLIPSYWIPIVRIIWGGGRISYHWHWGASSFSRVFRSAGCTDDDRPRIGNAHTYIAYSEYWR